MKAYLLIDFGSTYTKLTLVASQNDTILSTAKSITTIEDNIMTGYDKAFEILKSKIDNFDSIEIIDKIACSSAAGGLKIVAIGLVPELTAEAAKEASLGAGARVLKTYAYKLNSSEIEEIKSLNADLILLAGGTNGGNFECITHNAKKLAESKISVPIIVGGNKSANDEIIHIFNDANLDYYITENVMPQLNKINVKPAREKIREIFMEKIVEAKGLKNAEELIGGILMPTPAAVLKAAELLSKGSDEEEGIGDLIVIDIGGATTDVHSLSWGDPSKAGVIPKGLEEPYAKRTVEGDLGMRYSALSLFEASGSRKMRKYLNDRERKIDLMNECQKRHDNITMVPSTKEEIFFDEGMAKIATEISMTRHCGYLEPIYTPTGTTYYQYGKDLLSVRYIIGTGGVLIHSEKPSEILSTGILTGEEPLSLKPRTPKYLIDKTYILSAMGLLAERDENLAVRIMKKYLINA